MGHSVTDYALVQSDTIVRFGLPPSARRIDSGAWVLGLADATDTLRAACGYFPVVDVAAPTIASTEVAERSVALVNGSPSAVWTVRNKTADELNPPLSSEQKLTIVKTKLAELEALAAPILAADVADILAEIEGAI